MENNLKHSINFINKKTGKKAGFSVPENYFKTLELDVDTKIKTEAFSKKTPFKVSDSYFQNLEEMVLDRTIADKKPTKVISLKQKILKGIPYAAVASILLFIGLNTFVFNTKNSVSFETISDTEIEYWLNENSINTNEIATLLEDEISDETIFSFTHIDEESIEDYINSIDNAALLDELN